MRLVGLCFLAVTLFRLFTDSKCPSRYRRDTRRFCTLRPNLRDGIAVWKASIVKELQVSNIMYQNTIYYSDWEIMSKGKK